MGIQPEANMPGGSCLHLIYSLSGSDFKLYTAPLEIGEQQLKIADFLLKYRHYRAGRNNGRRWQKEISTERGER